MVQGGEYLCNRWYNSTVKEPNLGYFFSAVKVCEEKIKKSWAIVDAESHQKDDVKRDTVYCLNDDNETEVQKDDVIQGERWPFAFLGPSLFFRNFFTYLSSLG